MKNIPLRLLLIALACAIAASAVAFKPVRLGKDLRGGVSLVYAVKVPEGGRGEEIVAQVIDVLKQRVNPQGVFDIAFQPQGTDRFEVVMPLPNPEVRALQVEYRRALDALAAAAQISPTELDQALAAGAAPDRFGATGQRGADVRALQSAFTAGRDARAELQRALAAGAEADAIADVENRIVLAEIEENRLRAAILGQSLNQTRLLKALGLSTAPEPERDAGTGEIRRDAAGKPVLGISPRERELAAIRSEFPHLIELLDPVVAAYDAYVAKRTGLDDPEDLMRLLRGAGVLEFRIAVNPTNPQGVNVADLREQLAKRGPRNTDSAVARWFEINDLKQWHDGPDQLEQLVADPISFFAARGLVAAQYAGTYWVLLYTTDAKSLTHASGDPWALERAFRTVDPRLGGAAVGFQLDQAGALRMARLTGPHVGQQMAIVLDGQVYTAPTLNDRISGNGIITGRYSDADIAYLIRVLAAGSLEASITPDPISTSILGPSIGADNLEKGKEAIYLSVAFTCLVMLLYYFGAGLIANIGLAINVLLIFGLMALIDGTFTLPGLAGIALSVAMAVDANVLIYERIREELQRGENLRTAVQLGYSRALSAIIDGNITNLIVVLVLYKVGATEVKGFALVMCIGVGTTLFTGLFVSRTFFMMAMEWFGARRMPMLPTVFPVVSRLLTPKVDWVSIRWPLWIACAAVAVLSIASVFSRGRDMFETEFRGGVAMTLSTRPAASGEPAGEDGRLLLKRPEVQERIRAVGVAAGPEDPILHELRAANVLTVGEAGAESDATRFQIRVGNPPRIESAEMEASISRRVQEAVIREFRDELAVQLPLVFRGAGEADHARYTFPLERDFVGDAIQRAEVRDATGDFRGGVAIVIDGIEPPATPADVESRITRMRNQPDFSDTAGRRVRAIGVDPVDASDPGRGFRSMVVLVSDPALSSLVVEFETWDQQLARPEWRLVSTALVQQASLDEVSSFSPMVAESLAASAVVAVVLSLIGMLGYIWIRFGSFRYSTAAVTSLVFNVTCCLGFLSIAPLLAGTALGRALLIDEIRIDLNVIAGLLTIVGYAINDTIVILDRIRENKGKLPFATQGCVNDSINQTFSRTVLTGGSTLATAIILIALGGTGIRPFAYTFFIGLVAGTISSIVIAAPMIYSRREEEEERRKADLAVPASLSSGVPALGT